MEKLLVSGIVYSPIGDPKAEHASLIHTRNNFRKQKFPLTIVDQYERYNVGKFTKIKQIWVNIKGKEVPFYYGVGYISHKDTIDQILTAANGNGYDYHSWCSKFKWIEYSELKKGLFGEEWVPTEQGRWDKFRGVIACCTPCLNYVNMFLPYAPNKLNKKLAELHIEYKRHDHPRFDHEIYKKVKMTQNRFHKLFGDNFKKEKYINFNIQEYYKASQEYQY